MKMPINVLAVQLYQKEYLKMISAIAYKGILILVL